jgi:hypothetical protein
VLQNGCCGREKVAKGPGVLARSPPRRDEVFTHLPLAQGGGYRADRPRPSLLVRCRVDLPVDQASSWRLLGTHTSLDASQDSGAVILLSASARSEGCPGQILGTFRHCLRLPTAGSSEATRSGS